MEKLAEGASTDNMGADGSPTFVTSCSVEDRVRGEEIWEKIQLKLISEKHPTAHRVCWARIFYQDKGQDDIIPYIIGDYIRRREISFGANEVSTYAAEVEKVKKLVLNLSKGPRLDFARLEDSDFLSDRGRAFLLEVETLRSLMDEARIALTGAEMTADRLRALSGGAMRVGLDAALLGYPLEAMARHLAHVWLGCDLTLNGGRSGDGIDEVIVRVVEQVSGQEDRGTRRWLSELMTKLRKEHGQ